MKKYLSIIVLGVMLAFLVSGCATLQNWVGKAQPKTFELTIDEQKIVVNLPSEIPDMEKAIKGWHRCWNANMCGMGFDLAEECCIHYVNFWYSGTTVFGIIYVDKRSGEKTLCWFYANGKPIQTTNEKFQIALEEIYNHGLPQSTDKAKDI